MRSSRRPHRLPFDTDEPAADVEALSPDADLDGAVEQDRGAWIATLATRIVLLAALAAAVYVLVSVAGCVLGRSYDFVLRAVHAEGVDKGAEVTYGGMKIGEVASRKARRGAVEFDVQLSGDAEPDLVREDARWAFSGAYVVGGARHIVLEDAGTGTPAKRGRSLDLERVPPLGRLWQDILAVAAVLAVGYLVLRYRSSLGGLLSAARSWFGGGA